MKNHDHRRWLLRVVLGRDVDEVVSFQIAHCKRPGVIAGAKRISDKTGEDQDEGIHVSLPFFFQHHLHFDWRQGGTAEVATKRVGHRFLVALAVALGRQ
jgi:hypothetical protein